MTVQCIRCAHFDMRDNAAMAKVGMGKCGPRKLGVGEYCSATYRRECSTFDEAPTETAAKRIEWLAAAQRVAR